MGRYAYQKFMVQFSLDTQRLIAQELHKAFDIEINDFDWSYIDIRVKKANHQQRLRFADTVQKLQKFLTTDNSKFYDHSGRHIISIAEMARITGRNRKTVVDWYKKKILVDPFNYVNKKWICVESSIENLKKSNRYGR